MVGIPPIQMVNLELVFYCFTKILQQWGESQRDGETKRFRLGLPFARPLGIEGVTVLRMNISKTETPNYTWHMLSKFTEIHGWCVLSSY